MIYGYARCSTNESKQDISYQVRELKRLGVKDDCFIYLEYESGTKVDRVELAKLLNIVTKGDTIIATEVSRITRSTRQLCDIIEVVKDKNLKLVIGKTMTIDCTNGELDPMTKAFLQMTGVFSELERNMISQRVKLGMVNAKAKGKEIGRPKVTKDSIPSVFL
jgi:DNA invertase Pin-like site-specific DNA recombinase